MEGRMATSVYIPPDLLDRVDRAASRRRMSRSHFITMVVGRAVAGEDDWPEFFFDHMVNSALAARDRKKAGEGK